MSISTDVYQYLRTEILSLRLAPGSEINLPELEEKLHVSKSPIRAALRDLRYENLVSIVPQSGTHVQKIDISLMEEQRFLRAKLEIGVVQRLCQMDLNEDAEVGLAYCIKQQKIYAKDGKLWEFLTADDAFHEWFYKAVGFIRLWNLIKGQNGHYSRIRLLTFNDYSYVGDVIHEHEEILNAIKNHDSAIASDILDKHISALDVNKINAIRKNPEFFKGYDLSILD